MYIFREIGKSLVIVNVQLWDRTSRHFERKEKIYWKSDRKVTLEEKRRTENNSFMYTYMRYIHMYSIYYSSWVLDWIGLPRQQYKHLKARCGSVSPIPVSNWNYTFRLHSTCYAILRSRYRFSLFVAFFLHIKLTINDAHGESSCVSLLYLSFVSMKDSIMRIFGCNADMICSIGIVRYGYLMVSHIMFYNAVISSIWL